MPRVPKTIKFQVDPEFYEYAEEVRKRYRKNGVRVSQRDISRMLVRQVRSMRKTYGIKKTNKK